LFVFSKMEGGKTLRVANHKGLIGLSSIWFILFFLVCNSWAGQVVTKDVKVWAQEALKQEASLQVPKGRGTLGVLYFQNKTERPEINPVQKGLAAMLITDLSTVKGVQVIERVKLQALVEELGLGTSGLVEPDTAPRVGKLLGAEWLVGGSIGTGQTAEVLQIQSNFLDVPSEEILGQAMVKGALANLFMLEKDLLFEILKIMEIEVRPEDRERLMKPCTTNMNALMALFQGIEQSDRGEYEKAAEYYAMGLEADPKMCMAAEALGELRALGLIASKRSSSMLKAIKEQTSLTDQATPEDVDKRIKTPKEIIPTTTPTDIIIHFP
jgi:TolB-like protein